MTARAVEAGAEFSPGGLAVTVQHGTPIGVDGVDEYQTATGLRLFSCWVARNRPSTSSTWTSWTKSSYSGGSGTECVEVRPLSDSVGVRDSKDPAGPILRFTRDALKADLR